MAKSKTVVDSVSLQAAVVKAEKEQTYSNRTKLIRAVTRKYNELVPNAPITDSVCFLRLNEFKTVIATPKQKRGRPKKSAVVVVNTQEAVVQSPVVEVPVVTVTVTEAYDNEVTPPPVAVEVIETVQEQVTSEQLQVA